jgi:hypothetical protein
MDYLLNVALNNAGYYHQDAYEKLKEQLYHCTYNDE